MNKYKSEMFKVDKENQSINMEKDQAILKIKNSFMCKSAIQIHSLNTINSVFSTNHFYFQTIININV